MELKVWVEGVARVICGITSETPCQDVVIALAQAIGQTGRYVLVMKLRGTEKQLLPDECPLRHLAQLGQMAAEVQFILHRTGPSLGDATVAPAETLLRLPKPIEQAAFSEPQRALSFTQGSPPTGPWLKTNRTWSPRASPAPTASDKEEVFRQILQQRMKLKDLESEIQVLELETREWERMCSLPCRTSTPLDLEELERMQQQNEDELMFAEDWELLHQSELDREQDLQQNLQQIQRSTEEHEVQIFKVQERSAHLQQDSQLMAVRERTGPDEAEADEVLEMLQKQLQQRVMLGQSLDSEVSGMNRTLRLKEKQIQDRWDLVEEMNKELRQCNLQHFIKRRGGAAGTEQFQLLHDTNVYLHNAGILK